jgi:arginase family enzyme
VSRRRARAVVFPFDLFGSAGTAAGAELLADELREILADNRAETVATRARVYTSRLGITEHEFITPADYQDWRTTGQRLAREAVNADFTLWLTGNHLGALPVYDVLGEQSPPPLILQLDAHLDIHHFRDCQTAPTHGNFLLHVAGRRPPVVNVGHRDLLLPVEYIEQHYRRTIGISQWVSERNEVCASLTQAIAQTEQVWLWTATCWIRRCFPPWLVRFLLA